VEHEKDQAILHQKVEILVMQLKEAEEREQTIKRMHATMMQALDDQDLRAKVFCFNLTLIVTQRAGVTSQKLNGGASHRFRDPGQRA
jgi:hypothetical protein